MEIKELDEWAEDFETFHSRFAHLFGRREATQQAVKYLRGLLAAVERKNGWQIAEASGDATPDATQRLLYKTKWDADLARDELTRFAIDVFCDDEGIGVIDETGFIKKGRHSVGVQRQYCGTAGKTENCQIGTLLCYATDKGHVFLDRRLYLPETWCVDRERMQEAKVPAHVVFETKPEQAVKMLQQTWAAGVPMRWVTGDAVYGDAPGVRDAVAESGRWYVLGVRSHITVWHTRPQVAIPAWQGKGRKPTQPQVVDEGVTPVPLPAVVVAWPDASWLRLTVDEGEKGPRTYDWAYQRVVENVDHLPGRDAWLVARRSVSKPKEIAYFLSNAPADTALLTLAQMASTRYTVEQCIEEAKGDTGLDHYEVRYWHSWHRHITLSMLAHAWLASVRYKANEKKRDKNRSWQN